MPVRARPKMQKAVRITTSVPTRIRCNSVVSFAPNMFNSPKAMVSAMAVTVIGRSI